MKKKITDSKPQKTGQPWPNPFYAWYVVLVLTFAYMLSFVDRQIISLLVGPIQADLNIGDFEISLLQGMAFAFFYTILGLPIGRLADRANRKWIITIGITLWSGMTILCGLARTYGMLFLARMGVGVGEATLSPSAYSMISDYVPREKLGRALSIYFTGVYMGIGLAYIFGGYIVDLVGDGQSIEVPVFGLLQSWQIAFIAVGMPGLLFALVMLTIKEPIRRGVIQDARTINYRDSFKYLKDRRLIYGLFFTAFSLQALFGYGIGAWAPEFYVRVHGMSRADVGYTYGLIMIFMASSGAIFAGTLADKLEARGVWDAKLKVVIIGNIFLIPAALLFALLENTTASLIFLGLTSFLNAFPFGLCAAAIQSITPNERRGFVTAAYLFVINMIGLGLGPTVVASFTDFVFSDPMLVGWSMAATTAIAIPLGTLLILKSRSAYRIALEEMEEASYTLNPK